MKSNLGAMHQGEEPQRPLLSTWITRDKNVDK